MSEETGFSSIAEVMAAASQAKAEKARAEAARLKARLLGAQPKAAAASRPAPAAGNGAMSDDIMDDFDYALQAVEMARKSLPGNPSGVPRAAATILIAKRQIPGSDANDLIDRAIRYLDG